MRQIKITNINCIKALFEGDDEVVNRAINDTSIFNGVLGGDVETPWWLICITGGPGFPIVTPDRMKLIGCAGILCVAFDDVLPTVKLWEDSLPDGSDEPAWPDTIEYTYRMPTKHHIPEILDILSRVGEDERLVVNCEAGVSRSAAVAYFAAIRWGLVPDEIFDRSMYKPNNLVSALLRAAVGMTPFEESWEMLKKNPRQNDPWGDETK